MEIQEERRRAQTEQQLEDIAQMDSIESDYDELFLADRVEALQEFNQLRLY